MINYELILNMAIILLLIPTIIYLIKLNKNLNILKANQGSLENLVSSLNDAASKAESTIPQLKKASTFAAEELGSAAEKASKTKEELEFLVERAENLAGRLENVIYASRYNTDKKTTNKSTIMAKNQPENITENSTEHSEAELELLQALRSIK